MDDIGEADADEHGKDDGNGGEAYSALHDEGDEHVVLAPLDDVVDACDDESPHESLLCQSDENSGYCSDEGADVWNKLREGSKSSKGHRVGHTKDDKCDENERADGETKEELAAGPLCDLEVNRFGLAIHVRTILEGKESPEPPHEALFFQLDEESHDEDNDRIHNKTQDRSCDARGKAHRALGYRRKVLSQLFEIADELIDGEILESRLSESGQSLIHGICKKGNGDERIREEGIHFETDENGDLLQLGSNDGDEGKEEEEEEEESEEVMDEDDETTGNSHMLHSVDSGIDDDGDKNGEKDKDNLVADLNDKPRTDDDCKDGKSALEETPGRDAEANFVQMFSFGERSRGLFFFLLHFSFGSSKEALRLLAENAE